MCRASEPSARSASPACRAPHRLDRADAETLAITGIAGAANENPPGTRRTRASARACTARMEGRAHLEQVNLRTPADLERRLKGRQGSDSGPAITVWSAEL